MSCPGFIVDADHEVGLTIKVDNETYVVDMARFKAQIEKQDPQGYHFPARLNFCNVLVDVTGGEITQLAFTKGRVNLTLKCETCKYQPSWLAATLCSCGRTMGIQAMKCDVCALASNTCARCGRGMPQQ